VIRKYSASALKSEITVQTAAMIATPRKHADNRLRIKADRAWTRASVCTIRWYGAPGEALPPPTGRCSEMHPGRSEMRGLRPRATPVRRWRPRRALRMMAV
jgi:hypothetical protein